MEKKSKGVLYIEASNVVEDSHDGVRNLSVGLVDEINLWVGVVSLYGSRVPLDVSRVLVQLVSPQFITVQLQPL